MAQLGLRSGYTWPAHRNRARIFQTKEHGAHLREVFMRIHFENPSVDGFDFKESFSFQIHPINFSSIDGANEISVGFSGLGPSQAVTTRSISEGNAQGLFDMEYPLKAA